MRLNGNSSEPEPPPSFKWLEKHHPGRAIDLDERDFVEEVWSAAQLAMKDNDEADYCIHHEDEDEKPRMVNIADTEADPEAITLKCPECGWIPVELAS